eukprot:COSAG02_NODE_1515_length_12187_cov_37.042025_5_plen_69_part_00
MLGIRSVSLMGSTARSLGVCLGTDGTVAFAKQDRARKWEKELEAANKEKEGEVLRPIDPTTAAQLHPS